MKKHIWAVAAVMALVLCLTGCFPFSLGSDSSSVTLSENTSSSVREDSRDSSAVSDTSEETSASSETSEASDSFEATGSSQEESSQEESVPVGEEIRDHVVIDNEQVTFTIKSVYSDLFGYNMKVTVENKTDLTLVFSWSDTVVDGYSCDPYFYAEVAAGKKANEEITFYSESLEAIGVTSPTVISFVLHVYDSDDWSADYLVDERFTIYPQGEDAAAEPRDADPADAFMVLYEDSSIRIYILEAYTDLYGFNVRLYLQNLTDSTVMFALDEASVNGYMCDPFWACSVPASARAISEITWYQSDLEENDIETVEEIEFTMRAYDYDDWYANDLVNETFSFQVD